VRQAPASRCVDLLDYAGEVVRSSIAFRGLSDLGRGRRVDGGATGGGAAMARSDSDSPSGLESLSLTSVPGVLELLEQGELDDERPDFDRVPLPPATRGLSDALSPGEAGDRWRALLDRLRGYSRDEVLVSREPVWVPLVELQVPP